MDYCDAQNNTLVGCDEVGGYAALFDRKSPVACPKPRRVEFLGNNPTIMSLRRHKRLQELCDWKAGAELLDIITEQEQIGTEKISIEAASSPPYFSGSPPSRVPNPLVLDARFGHAKPSPSSPLAHKGGCARMNFSLEQAAVRVEGFDCRGRDRQNSSITAVA
ncbi:hypothetical protein Droror1_Dr00024597 [Drosera rotundifolia]